MGMLADDLEAEISKLVARFCLRVDDEMYSPEHFGNRYIELRGNGVNLRFVRDRGDLLFQISAPESRWWQVENVLRELSFHPIGDSQMNVPELVDMLCANHDEVVRKLGQQPWAQKDEILVRIAERMKDSRTESD